MEVFYELMANQRWAEVLDLVKTMQPKLKANKKEWAYIASILEAEFIKFATIEKPVLVARLCRDYIGLNNTEYIGLSDKGREDIETLGILAALKESNSAALAFAKLCKFSTKAKEVITQLDDAGESPQSQSNHARTDWLTSLFKSKNETMFYQALEELFPNYLVYPNMTLANIFDFGSIKSSLSKREMDYYFEATIDFVVYDPEDNYNPRYFFELEDSCTSGADHEYQLKSNICAAANIRLPLVPKVKDSLTTVADYKNIISEIVQ